MYIIPPETKPQTFLSGNIIGLNGINVNYVKTDRFSDL